MAAEIELKKINEYVQECLAITSITGAYVYGIDSNGNSIKIAVEVLASAGTDYSQQIAALTTKCNNNTTLITALQTAVNGKANAVHTHQISDVANLQTALDGKSNTGHTHVISDVANLQTALNGKADANHTHGMSAIVGLTDALNSKANSAHTHAIGDVVNLQPTLANHEQRITDLEGQGGGSVGNALKQVDLSTYSGGSNGEIVQHVGETTADYINGYTYKCEAGEAEKTIPAGSQCIRLTQGGEEYISDGEADTTTDKMVMVLQPTAEGITYNVFAAQTIAENDIETLVGCYVPDEIGAIHQITAITHNGTTLTSVTLDNGVTLEISSSTPTKSTLAWYEYFSKSGERFYGGSGTVGYMIASKDFVSAPSGDQFYPIATEPIGTAFGGTVQNFTASEDIVIRSVEWTQSPTQPETSVASGDAFLSQTDGAIGSTISIGYNSTNQHLELKGINGAVAAFVDMAVFIKDGMLENVEKYTTPEQGITVAVPYLKFTFNTDAGKSVIRISFADLIDTFDGSNVDLTSAFVKATTYSAPTIGDNMNVAIGKLLKGHEDNAAAIATKQPTLTFDDAPMTGSNNPVKSQGIKAAIDAAVGNVPNALKQKDLTTYQGTDGEIVQHTGVTTANYTDGYVYKFDEVPSDYPSNTLAVRLNGAIANMDSNPINAAALIGNDRNYVKTTPTPYLSEDRATWFQFTERTTPIVGDGVVVEASDTFDYGVITGINEYSTKYYCTIQIGERSVHYYLPKASTLPTKYTFVNNSGQFIISRFANINEEYYLDNPSTSENWPYFVVANGNAYPIVVEEEWMGNSNLLPAQSGWQRINVQPSSEGAVSDLETRMTAAETAISGKQAAITGAASTITTANLTASKVLASDANGKVVASSVTATELGYLSGATANIQQLLNGKQATLTFDDAPMTGSNNPVKSGGIKTAIDFAPRFYIGTCSTAGNVAIKQVDIPNFPTQLVNGVETPIVGSVIAVKYQYDSEVTSSQRYLKVNNTNAYPFWYSTSEYTDTTTVNGIIFGSANKYIYYLFNGTHWVWINHGVDLNNSYTPQSLGFGYASCTTDAATAAKTASLSNYNLANGGLIVIYFENDVPAQATLNINNKGAKEIHFGSSHIAAGVIKAGDKCLFIYNGNYMLIAIDRWGKELQEKVSGINISETDFESLSTYEQGKLYFVYDNS